MFTEALIELLKSLAAISSTVSRDPSMTRWRQWVRWVTFVILTVSILIQIGPPAWAQMRSALLQALQPPMVEGSERPDVDAATPNCNLILSGNLSTGQKGELRCGPGPFENVSVLVSSPLQEVPKSPDPPIGPPTEVKQKPLPPRRPPFEEPEAGRDRRSPPVEARPPPDRYSTPPEEASKRSAPETAVENEGERRFPSAQERAQEERGKEIRMGKL